MIISLLKAIILGIVEGLTEFLPISSTGHLIVINHWISFGETFTFLFDVVIQLGAILAVVIYFWNVLWPFGKDEKTSKKTWNIWLKTMVGVLPAIVCGALFNDFMESHLLTPWVVALALIAGGAVLLMVEKKKRVSRINSIDDLSYQQAGWIWLIQCLAMIPGVSRSAATIVGGMCLGASRVVAAEFSFFLAIVTMTAASGYTLLKHASVMSGAEMLILLTGFVTSFVVAGAVIKFFMVYIQKHDFKLFAYYRIALGLIILVVFWLIR